MQAFLTFLVVGWKAQKGKLPDSPGAKSRKSPGKCSRDVPVMAKHERPGKSDEWYTPAYIFEAMGCRFDLDVASPENGPLHVPTSRWISRDSLSLDWTGFVWMNPPFGGRNGIVPWLKKFVGHQNGIALTPDRTSAPWWPDAARFMDAILFVSPKIKFIPGPGAKASSPAQGTCLMALGSTATAALERAARNGLGTLCIPSGVSRPANIVEAA
jgi:hypothetical protein